MRADNELPITELIMNGIGLMPNGYRKAGIAVLVLGIPLSVVSLIFLKAQNFSLAPEWAPIILHYPISITLIVFNFSKEKQEDEMVQFLRYQSFMRGVRVLAISLLLFPFISNLSRVLQGKPLGFSDLGGMLAVLNLLLFYIFAFFKINLYLARKKFSAHEE